jgi:hypothetical protein
VEGVQAEEAAHEAGSLGVKRGSEFGRGDRVVEVLDDKVLREGSGETPEVNEEAVPRALLDVALLEGLESEVGRAPGERGDDVAVVAEDVKGGTLVAAGEVGLENARGVVSGAFAGEYGTGGFKELNCQ